MIVQGYEISAKLAEQRRGRLLAQAIEARRVAEARAVDQPATRRGGRWSSASRLLCQRLSTIHFGWVALGRGRVDDRRSSGALVVKPAACTASGGDAIGC
jgi:hypothetical protein